MNRPVILLLLAIGVVVASCGGDEDLLPEYMIDKPKMLAVVVENPETPPGSTVATRVLIAGRQIDQTQNQDVNCLAAFDPPEQCLAGYNDVCTLTIPEPSELDDDFQDNVWFDVPVLGQTKVLEKNYYAQKTLRVTTDPVGGNPEVEAVDVAFLIDGELRQDIAITEPGGEILFQGESSPVNIAFTAVPADLDPPDTNDKLIYTWKVSLSKDGGSGRLYTNTDSDDVHEILGEGAKAAEYRQSVVFSLRGEELNAGIQYGRYDIYLLVRDQASDAKDRSEDRLGMTFFYFTLVIEKETILVVDDTL